MKIIITNKQDTDWKKMSLIHKGEIVYERNLHKETIPLIREIINEITTQLELLEIIK